MAVETYWLSDVRGCPCGIYGFADDGKKPSRRGRFQLFIDDGAGADGDPRIEGSDAAKMEAIAKKAGAASVTHWYEP